MLKVKKLMGRKVGMTRVFDMDGLSIPVTVIQITPNVVCQKQICSISGKSYVQLGAFEVKKNRLNKPALGHFISAGVEPKYKLQATECAEDVMVGDSFGADLFSDVSFVDVSGHTMGKGFAGTIKRHNFSSGRASHGNSKSHNVPGSISMAQDPGRVFPGKRMSGHMGNVMATIQNLKVIRVDVSKDLIFIKGAVPGGTGSIVSVRASVKK